MIMVIELIGVLFGLESYAWFQIQQKNQFFLQYHSWITHYVHENNGNEREKDWIWSKKTVQFVNKLPQ